LTKPRDKIAHIRVRLDTLGRVTTEKGRLYRLSLKGIIPPDILVKWIATLDSIQRGLEAQTLDLLYRRMLDAAARPEFRPRHSTLFIEGNVNGQSQHVDEA